MVARKDKYRPAMGTPDSYTIAALSSRSLRLLPFPLHASSNLHESLDHSPNW